MLSDIISDAGGLLGGCLNAPFGAQCFPTLRPLGGERSLLRVSMHLLVLSAFRPGWLPGQTFGPGLVSMHLLVLSAFRHEQIDSEMDILRSQCTFWCSVLSDIVSAASPRRSHVSMHLLVLSAFRQYGEWATAELLAGLNAPFGAQCFPTLIPSVRAAERATCLNAPFGAQCFPTRSRTARRPCLAVSMHLLVLSAFRLDDGSYRVGRSVAVSMHLLVLSAFRHQARRIDQIPFVSQCTFWCSVLSDVEKAFVEAGYTKVSMHLLVLSAFRRERARSHGLSSRAVSMHLLVLSAFRLEDVHLAFR